MSAPYVIEAFNTVPLEEVGYRTTVIVAMSPGYWRAYEQITHHRPSDLGLAMVPAMGRPLSFEAAIAAFTGREDLLRLVNDHLGEYDAPEIGVDDTSNQLLNEETPNRR